MATEVKSQLIEQSRLRQTDDGYEQTQLYRVSGLASADLERLQFDALNAPGVPRQGQPHAFLPGVSVRSVEARPRGRTVGGGVTVAVNWGGTSGEQLAVGETVIEVGTTTQQVQTNQHEGDSDRTYGRDLVVFRTDADGQTMPTQDGKKYPQTFTSETLDRVSTLRFTRREAIGISALSSKSAQYAGHANEVAIWGWGANRWACLSLTGTSGDGGETYLVRYEFALDRNGWYHVGAFTEGGVPLSPLVPNVSLRGGDGFGDYRQLPLVDFNGLSLPF